MKLITNQSNGSFEAYIERGRNRRLSPNWRQTLESTIELVNFIKVEVQAPPQWFVVSHMMWIHIVKNSTWGGHKDEILLTAQIIKGVYHFTTYPSLDKNEQILIGSKEEAKVFLEKIFNA